MAVAAYFKCDKCHSFANQFIIETTTICEKCEFVKYMQARYNRPLDYLRESEESEELSKIKRPSKGET